MGRARVGKLIEAFGLEGTDDPAARIEALEAERDEWRQDFRALEKAIVGDTGLSAMTVAAQARKYRPMYEALEAENTRLREAIGDIAEVDAVALWSDEKSGVLRRVINIARAALKETNDE